MTGHILAQSIHHHRHHHQRELGNLLQCRVELLLVERQRLAVHLGHGRRRARRLGQHGHFAEDRTGLDVAHERAPGHQAHIAIQQQVHLAAAGEEAAGLVALGKETLAARHFDQFAGRLEELQRHGRRVQRGQRDRRSRRRRRLGRGLGRRARKIQFVHVGDQVSSGVSSMRRACATADHRCSNVATAQAPQRAHAQSCGGDSVASSDVQGIHDATRRRPRQTAPSNPLSNPLSNCWQIVFIPLFAASPVWQPAFSPARASIATVSTPRVRKRPC